MEHRTIPPRELASYRKSVWALMPQAVAVIASAMRQGAVSAEVIEPSEAPEPPKGVAVIPLKGVITPDASILSLLFGGGGGLKAFRQELRSALADEEVGQILLDIDSPGGSTDLVAEVAAEVRAAREVKPITAVANTLAASAAYWIGSQANELVVSPSGEVGSIGVMAVHEDWSEFNAKFGVEPTYVSAGRFKVEGNPDAPLSDEARESWQGIVDDFYGMFVSDVANGRGVAETMVRNGYGEGRVLTAQKAVDAGLADRIETFEGTVGRLLTAETQRGTTAAAPGVPTSVTYVVNGVDGGVVTGTSGAQALADMTLNSLQAERPKTTTDNPAPNSKADDEDRARIERLLTKRHQHRKEVSNAS